jgi:hypothetical protein
MSVLSGSKQSKRADPSAKLVVYALYVFFHNLSGVAERENSATSLLLPV